MTKDITERLELEHLQVCGLMNPEQCDDPCRSGIPCVCQVIEDARTEIITLRDDLSFATEWQPLETAPTDGSFFLGWMLPCDQDDAGLLDLVYYVVAADEYCWKGHWFNGIEPYHRSQLQAWMPLPNPPVREDLA